MKALILAGGFGTRLKPLTNNTPKPILPICNRPFLTYQIELLKNAGITQIILALHHQHTKIKYALGNGSKYDVELKYIIEPRPLGTAGAFKNAEKLLDDTTIVLNGDSILDFNLKSLITRHKDRKALSTIALTTVDNPALYGTIETESDGKVKSFNEKAKKKQRSGNTINAGVYAVGYKMLEMIPNDEFYMFEKDIFPTLAENKYALYSYTPKNHYWIDIGSPSKYLQANIDFLANKTKSFKIYQSSTFLEKHPCEISMKRSLAANSCSLGIGCLITNSVIGEKCVIGKNVKLYNSVIFPNTRISDNSQIFSSVIGSSSVINDSCTLQDTFLGDGSFIAENTLTKANT